jgi:hypothetical protein
MTENRTKEKNRTEGEEMVWEKDYMDMGQNGRIEKKRERRMFGEEDTNGYGSKWENKEKEGKERIWGGRPEWIWVKLGK